MKAFFRLVLLGLILLVVALVSALTTMRFAIHGREVAVPELVGKTPQEGRAVAELNGFQFQIERQYYSPKVPSGRILSQLPAAGTRIRRGWQIRVAESLGPQRVEIPNVLGESERAAEINVLRRGLNIGSVANIEMPGVPADQVVAQSPSPSASSISAPRISLLAAQPESPQAFIMPTFVGQALGNATQIVKNAGLQVGAVTLAPPPQPADATAPASTTQPTPASIIRSQKPTAGSKVVAGSAVSFEVQ